MMANASRSRTVPMIASQLKVKNWRNFRSIDVSLRERQFVVGPNAAGKSNFLDIFRFLHDVAKREGGGLQKALKDRGGAKTPEKTRNARFRTIEGAVKIAVPQLEQLQFTRDDATGRPHLQALYSHWRPKAGWQQEDQFSDGTLRLIGLLWALLEGDSLLLLEEPELSLNAGIVAQLAPLIARFQRNKRRQVLISTHSDALLTEQGIDGREVLLLTPANEGTEVVVASEVAEVRTLLEAGLTVGEAVLPRTGPSKAMQLSLIQ
jgi:predicted ATPase